MAARTLFYESENLVGEEKDSSEVLAAGLMFLRQVKVVRN
jgi:hypothetical protein